MVGRERESRGGEVEGEGETKETFISLEEQHENFVAAVRKYEMLAATKCKVKMSASKKKVNKDDTYDTSSIKRETSCNQEVSESVTL